MTLDEADKAVFAALEKRDDAINDLITAFEEEGFSDVVEALNYLAYTQDEYHKYLDVWGALDALEKPVGKEEVKS